MRTILLVGALGLTAVLTATGALAESCETRCQTKCGWVDPMCMERCTEHARCSAENPHFCRSLKCSTLKLWDETPQDYDPRALDTPCDIDPNQLWC